MKKIIALLLTAAALATVAVPQLSAQPSGAVQAITPLSRDLGALIKMSAQTAATVNSADQSGYNVSRITCVLNHTSKVGTPNSTFTIQGKDAASGLYYTLIASTALTNTATANPISVGAGIANSANVSASLPVPATWRVSLTVGGSTSVTGTIGCTVQ